MRKSLRVGPMRVNLSKSGIGASVGVKGARVGINSGGRPYVAGGKGNLFFRENLSTKTNTKNSPIPIDNYQDSGTTSFVDTGVCYPSFLKEEESLDIMPPVPNKTGMGCLIVTAILFFWFPPVSLTLAGLCIYLFFKYRSSTQIREKMCEDLSNLVKSLASVEKLDPIFDKAMGIKYKGIYKKSFSESLLLLLVQYASARLTSGEPVSGRYTASNLFGTLDIKPERGKKILKWNFICILRSYLEDRFLDVDEEMHLRNYIELAELRGEDISGQVELINRMAKIRAILKKGLEPKKVNFKLQRGEECYVSTPAKLLKEKQISRHQEAGVVYKQMGYEIDKEGELYLTNKRLIFIHSGATNIDLQKILNISVYPEKNLFSLAREGRERPVLVTVPDAITFSQILNHVWSSS